MVGVWLRVARVAWGAFMRAAKDIAGTGTFDALGSAASFAEIDLLFGRTP